MVVGHKNLCGTCTLSLLWAARAFAALWSTHIISTLILAKCRRVECAEQDSGVSGLYGCRYKPITGVRRNLRFLHYLAVVKCPILVQDQEIDAVDIQNISGRSCLL